MSTWALFGLVVVVVLVAVGIAGLLRWGRGREDDVSSSDGGRPRTVADLVDRRARGLDDGPRRPAPVPDGPDPAPPVDDEAPEPRTADGADEVTPGPTDAPADDGDTRAADEPDDDHDAVAATTPVPAVLPRPAEREHTAAEDGPEEFGPSSSAPDITEAVGAADPTDELPTVPRVTPDVSAGPVGPPWSRGFKDGKPLEPVEPSPARRAPAPTPFVRRRAVVDPAAHTVDDAAAVSGPDSSAPDISTPTTGVAAVGTAAVGTAAVVTAADTAATADAAETDAPAAAVVASDRPDALSSSSSSSSSADGLDVDDDEAVDEEPPVAATQARAPFDADLVRRVTAVPSERVSSRAPADPDTEREFREARDRITTPHTWAGRVPEQGGAPEPAADTPAVSRIPSIGLAATGARAAAENPEPPPRPAPRVLRSARPGGGPRHLAASPRPASGDDTGPDDAPGPDTATPGELAVDDREDTAAGTADRDDASGSGVTAVDAPGVGPAEVPDSADSADTADTDTADRHMPTADAGVTDAGPTDAGATDATAGGTATIGAGAATAVAAVAATAAATSAATPAATPPEDVAPEDVAPHDAAPQTAIPDPTDPRPTTPERPVPAPEAEESIVHAGPTTATRPDRAEDIAEDVALSVPRTGPAPSTVVPGTAPRDVEVRVVDATDAPLPGAEVALRDRSGGPLGSAVTDAGGTAHLTTPGAGAFVVVARLDGHLPGVSTCTVGDDDASTTLRLAAAAVVHGSAPAGATVVLSQDGEPVASAAAAADGTYRLADLDPGRYLLAAGDGPAVEVDLTSGTDERRDLAGS